MKIQKSIKLKLRPDVLAKYLFELPESAVELDGVGRDTGNALPARADTGLAVTKPTGPMMPG